MTTFRQFIRSQRNNPPTQFGGDFIEDALGDKPLPPIKKWDDLYDFMTSAKVHACREAIEGALDVWHAYVLSLIRNGEYVSRSEKAFQRKLRKRMRLEKKEREARRAHRQADEAAIQNLFEESGPAYDENAVEDAPADNLDDFDGGEDEEGKYHRADGSRIGSEVAERPECEGEG